jgi:hypothetical protein
MGLATTGISKIQGGKYPRGTKCGEMGAGLDFAYVMVKVNYFGSHARKINYT